MTGLVLFFLFFLAIPKTCISMLWFRNHIVVWGSTRNGFTSHLLFLASIWSSSWTLFYCALIACRGEVDPGADSPRNISPCSSLINSASHIITEIYCTPRSYMLRPYVILIVAIIIITCRDPLSGPILNFPENVRKTTNPSQIYQFQLQCDWKRMSNPVTIHRIVNQIFQNYSLQFYWYLYQYLIKIINWGS